MKTKKLISFITVLALMTSAVFAAETAVETEITVPYTKTVKSGTFKSYDDGQILLNDGIRDFAINTDENTLFIDSDAKKFDITSAKNDTEFTVVADLAQTRSIPPQSYGYVVIEKISDNMPLYAEVADINGSQMTSADGEYIINVADTAEITAFGTGEKLSQTDIVAGASKILVYSDIMTMSIPAQVPTEKIVVLNPAENVTEPVSDYNKTTLYGTFKSYDDGQILLNDGTRDFAVNTDENTLFIDSDAKKFDITSAKNDTEFTVVADLAQTRSIPPQSYGYVVIAKTSDNMPIYVEVNEITDDGIVSADGKYIIRIPETAEIKAFGTDKTLAKSDIKADSKILVYSDIMTMSIPAQVPADKIVVLDSRENNELSREEILDCLRRLIKVLGFDGIFYK